MERYALSEKSETDRFEKDRECYIFKVICK